MDGVLVIRKEKGYTSHDVVAKLRGILHMKKIGHTGTLDPDAEGVLPVCLGKATKLCDLLAGHDKVYEAVMLLGQSTDTQDTTGTVLESATVTASEEEVREAVLSFEGPYEQIPPMYSALKVNGQKLCDLARAGKEVERKARPVVIHEITILEMDLPRVKMRVHCSSGTYIRTLCHDIGEKLGCHGCMDKLLRTRVERFCVEDSLTLSQIETIRDEERLEEIIIPIDRMFDEEPAVHLNEELSKAAHNGNALPLGVSESKPAAGQKIRVYDVDGAFVGLYQYEKERDRQHFRLLKMFYEK